jgi:mono/diheme cytochrome c family protein
MISRADNNLFVLLAVALCVVSAAAGAQEPAAHDAGPLRAAGCAGCHGAEGRGTVLAPPIVGPELSAAQFLAAVRTARGAMPAYSAEVLPDQMAADLHEYLSAQHAPSAPDGRIDIGARLYEQYGCYSCHSNQGQGGTQGPRIGPDPVRWGRFVWYNRYPSGQMPPYSTMVMSDQDLSDIYAFLEARPAARPASSIPLLEP